MQDKIYHLNYDNGKIIIDCNVKNNTLQWVMINHKDFKCKAQKDILSQLVVHNQCITDYDLKCLMLHLINKCTPFALVHKNFNDNYIKNNVIKIVG